LNKADDVIEVVKALHHTKDPWAGHLFNLKPWQEKWLGDIFGTFNPDGTRQYRTAYIEIPRKNGKSELAAAIVMYLLFWEGERGGEIYSAAADRDQASIVFGIVVSMIRQDPFYLEKCRIYESTKTVKVPELNAKYQALSAEHATKHGFNASAIIFDELHVQPNRERLVGRATNLRRYETTTINMGDNNGGL
jgi:phage terminase large subunit-like protein